MPPPMMSNTRLAPAGAEADSIFPRGLVAADSSAVLSVASRRIVRTSSSTERPLRAARSRRRFFNRSSRWRTVKEGIKFSLADNIIAENDRNAIIAIKPLSFALLDERKAVMYLTDKLIN